MPLFVKDINKNDRNVRDILTIKFDSEEKNKSEINQPTLYFSFHSAARGQEARWILKTDLSCTRKQFPGGPPWNHEKKKGFPTLHEKVIQTEGNCGENSFREVLRLSILIVIDWAT